MITDLQSHSARSAWIEIGYKDQTEHILTRRTPQGVRGLKLLCNRSRANNRLVALRKECVDWNGAIGAVAAPNGTSHSARSAWIEMPYTSQGVVASAVALRKECVDWNDICEGTTYSGKTSHSARSAWIEMYLYRRGTQKKKVALRKECVDWNAPWRKSNLYSRPSHSARSAWIEMRQTGNRGRATRVALRKECVDWNNYVIVYMLDRFGRTPQGVRGLKLSIRYQPRQDTKSHSARSAWIEITSAIATAEQNKSHSARSAWIEMHLPSLYTLVLIVALRKECVDWNKS